MEGLIDRILDAISDSGLVEVEISARHVHLTQDAVEALFGTGATLTPKRPLSQPGQFLAEERITLIGSKGRKENVAVLGPARSRTQTELSGSDCIALGVTAPYRESGDVDGAGTIILEGPKGQIEVPDCVIIARSHVHVPPQVARKLGLADQQKVCVELLTQRPLILKNVVIRVSDQFSYRMHIDFDEANAGAVSGFTLGKIIA